MSTPKFTGNRGRDPTDARADGGESSGAWFLQRTLKNFYWSDNDFLLDDGVIVVDVLGQKVPRCGGELRQAVHCEIARIEATHLTRYRLQVTLCRCTLPTRHPCV